MMDYYEELGLDRSASPEEIRRAYRRIARLLHPDRCGDERVRRLAELQMKRLNGVLATLTSPEERMRYDRVLAIGPAPRDVPHVPGTRLPQWFWQLAFAVTFVILTSLLVYLPGPTPSKLATAGQRTAPAAKTATHPPRQTRPQLPGAGQTTAPQVKRQTPEDSGRKQASSIPFQPTVRAAPVAEPSAIAWPPKQPERSVVVPVAPPETAPGPARPTLAGEWLFAPSSRPQSSELYPPEYIELRVTQEAGILHGRYRARYHIPDQAISPNVAFQFEGVAAEESASLPWSGAGGSKGEITLRLLGSGALEVTWVANQLGEELGLISGTARLVRRLD